MTQPTHMKVVCLRCGESKDIRSYKSPAIIERFCPQCKVITHHNFRRADAKPFSPYQMAQQIEPDLRALPGTRE